jgi:tetratricopeptide (TPR) repeat protein
VPLPGGGRAIDPAFAPEGDDERRLAFLRQFLLSLQPDLPPVAEPSPLLLGEVTAVMHERALAERGAHEARTEQMLLSLGWIYRQAELPGASRDVLLELRDLRPNASYVYYNLGLAYRDLGDFAAAEAALLRAIDLARASSRYDVYEPFSNLRLGQLYLDHGLDEQARASLRSALDTYRWPYLPELYEALVTAESRVGNQDRSEQEARRLEYLTGTAAQ